MKILLCTPWQNRWRESTQKAFEKKGHQVRWLNGNDTLETICKADIILSMWADKNLYTIQQLDPPFKGKVFSYIRSYELYEDVTDNIQWDKLSGIFFVSQEVCRASNERWNIGNIPQYYIPNWIDTEGWPLVDKKQNCKIAMVAQINFKKCFPLALQIIDFLPQEYSLHIIGQIQDRYHFEYMDHLVKELGLIGRIFYYGELDPKDVNEFLKDKSYILSTSIKEGCPMNILEAMSMGIKPIIHNWPGAKSLFPENCIWTRMSEILPILKNVYDPKFYRTWIEKNYNLQNADKIVEIVTA